MQHHVPFSLVCSCLLHLALLLSVNTTPKGRGASEAPAETSSKISNTPLLSGLVYVTSPKVVSQTFRDLEIQPAAPQKTASPVAATAVVAPASSVRPIASDALDRSQNLHGLEGKSNITYWPSDEVDEAALMLAEWPEGVGTSAWPSGQFVRLELWINPDGALAEIAFPQKDLPDSLRITLVEIISHAGFKPALKNGEPVGNYRILEVLLSQISVPSLVKY